MAQSSYNSQSTHNYNISQVMSIYPKLIHSFIYFPISKANNELNSYSIDENLLINVYLKSENMFNQ